MKVVLCLPPVDFLVERVYIVPPLGLAYIGAVLQQKNIDVEIIDPVVEDYSWKNIKEQLIAKKPDIIGVTFTTDTRFDGLKLIKLAKKYLPDSIVVAGGPHITFTAHDFLVNIPELDVICRGEGEFTFLELVEAVRKNKTFKSISGISFRDNGEIIHNPPRPFIDNLDNIPFPARHLLPINKYVDFERDVPGKGKIRFTTIITSRGCPNKCCFCAASRLWGGRFRPRSPSNVLAEIKHIIDNYGIQGFWFPDDTFTIDMKRVHTICDMILDEGLDISWYCNVRVDSVDENLLKKMKEAGCFSIAYGVESGSQRILDEVIGKRISLTQVKKVKKWCDSLGIEAKNMFTISLPTETKHDAQKTLELMRELGDVHLFNILLIYPGTAIESISTQKGILPKNFSWAQKNSKVITMPSFLENAPIFLEKMTWRDICEIYSECLKITNQQIGNRLPVTIMGIKSFDELKRLLIMIVTYLKHNVLHINI